MRLALKSIPSPSFLTVLIGEVDETALAWSVGLLKHPVADPMALSEVIEIKSQKRPVMFGHQTSMEISKAIGAL